MSGKVIAIDGPAASGKSVVGQAVARRLGYRFLDTGAMYRAMTWAALERGIDTSDEAALARLAGGARVDVTEGAGPGTPTGVRVDGADATPHLRSDAVEAHVSLVSRVPAVRAALVRVQRALAAAGAIVMAGRDIGTEVLPDADLKVYLDADTGVRARRRAEELRAAGRPADVAAITSELARRDGIDSTREASPLTAARDAVIIDTGELTVAQVVDRIMELVG
jgi:cytidylate kinase